MEKIEQMVQAPEGEMQPPIERELSREELQGLKQAIEEARDRVAEMRSQTA